MLSRFQLTTYLSCLLYITLLGEKCWKVAHTYRAFTLLCKIASFAPTKILTLIRWLKQHFKYFYNELKLKRFNKNLRQQFNRITRSWKKIIEWEIKTSIQYEHEKLRKNQHGDVRNWNHKNNLWELISIWNQHTCKTKKVKNSYSSQDIIEFISLKNMIRISG
jgi:hypothetical protein